MTVRSVLVGLFCAVLSLSSSGRLLATCSLVHVSPGQPLSGSWGADCNSTHRSGRYARFYSFSLSSQAEVQIDLTSSTDAYLILLNGTGTSGSVVEENDDGGGSNNSRIVRTLSSGSYTIEATTYSSQRTGSFSLSLRAIGAPCSLVAIALGQTFGGSWGADCNSTHRSGRYARFYSFSLGSQTQVQIDLTSSTDAYLILLNGTGTSGSVVEENDDGGGSNNSRIVRTLSSGSYTIEATTYSSQRTGSFSLSLRAIGAPPPPPPSCSLVAIALGQTLGGSWGTDCNSTHRSGRYARFYSFSLGSQTQVQIDLTSSTDAYLILLNGTGTSGSVVEENDDGGGANNSRIVRTLLPGSYTIEATTYSSQRTGSFSLSLRAIGAPPPPPPSCSLVAIALGQTLSGSWGADCNSTHRSGRYARFHSFSLGSQTEVQIDLTSSTDAYLILLNGSGTSGSVVEENDDGGGANNSRIVRTLSPGRYTIEATTYSSQRTGSFSLSLRAVGAPPPPPPPSCSLTTLALGQTLGGSWGTDCNSTHRSGRYARFYSFSLSSQTQVQIDLISSTDAYLILLNGTGTTGSVVEENDDGGGANNSRIVRTLSVGSYTIEATTYSSERTGSFSLSASGGSGVAVYLVHGIRQSHTDMESLATNLRARLDPQRFTVDAGFDFSSCTQNNGCDATLCTIPVGAGLLGGYINARASTRSVVVIGFSLGGLLARDMMLNNRHDVATDRRIAQLITLGTPNAGYPYCVDDRAALCGELVVEMASNWRVQEAQNTVVLSNYLFSLDTSWGASSFVGLPERWLAVAGTSCHNTGRAECAFPGLGPEQGCASGDLASDNTVCRGSALYRLNVGNTPTERWENTSYQHAESFFTPICHGNSSLMVLSNPPVNSSLFQKLVDTLNSIQ